MSAINHFNLVVICCISLSLNYAPPLFSSPLADADKEQSVDSDLTEEKITDNSSEVIKSESEKSDSDSENRIKEDNKSSLDENETPLYFWPSNENFYKDLHQKQEEALKKSQIAADESQQRVSQRLHQFSAYVDKFFADETYIQENNESRLRLSISNKYQKHYDPILSPHMSLYLALPNTKNRWRLQMQSDGNENDTTNQDANNLISEEENTTPSTSLGRILRTDEFVDISFDAGIKFHTPVDPFTRLRARRTFKFENVELRFTETLGWQDSEGNSAENKLALEYPLSPVYFFRSGSKLTYWDIHTYWTGSQSFTIFNLLSKKSVIAYTFGISGQDENDDHLYNRAQINQYWTEVKYRKNFYKNWLFYQLTPGVTWPREFDFEALPRIELKLEAVYGYGSMD